MPGARLAVVNVAMPPATEALPREVVPSRNVTVPAAPAGNTLAVKVAAAPAGGSGFGLVRMVVVGMEPGDGLSYTLSRLMEVK